MEENTTVNSLKNSELERLFSDITTTENGDITYKSTGDKMIDILFTTDYLGGHLDEVPNLGTSEEQKLFAMFIRDPRLGLGRRDLGRTMLYNAGASFDQIQFAGRADDIWASPLMHADEDQFYAFVDEIKQRIDSNDEFKELYKKWLPRYSSKNLMVAREIAHHWGMNKQQYGHYVKCDRTVEQLMSRKRFEDIVFEHVPSLAALKYSKAFAKKQPERYNEYLEKLRSGEATLHVTTTNCYDIYRNKNIDQELFFSKYLERLNLTGSWIPIVDTSGSMSRGDSIGKALSIGYTLSRTSTYAPNEFLTFSDWPELIKVEGNFSSDMYSMSRANWDNSTNLSAVMDLLRGLKNDFPEWLVILSDMQFNVGSRQSTQELMRYFRQIGAPTKIVWWNFRCKTAPEKTDDGNIFLSGYSPELLSYLQCGFDGKKFLETLLLNYKEVYESYNKLS
jgi:hypothetical protein